jgi:hypothetical protein
MFIALWKRHLGQHKSATRSLLFQKSGLGLCLSFLSHDHAKRTNLLVANSNYFCLLL